MSCDSFIQKKKTDRNAKALADNFLNKWNQNKNSSTQELLWLIKNYKNFNSILLLILQVVDEELIKWKIDHMYIGLYELIITMLVDQFIIDWIDCYKCNIQANEKRYTEIREQLDLSGVPFVIGYLESSVYRDDEYLSEQPVGFYNVKTYFSIVLDKKLEENSIIQENFTMRETVERCKHAEDGILFTMAREIAIMDMHNNSFPCITNDNLIRIPYDPNMIVSNLFILSWFYKMFAHAQLELSHPVKNVSKLPSEIIDYMIKKYFKYSYFCLKLQ